MQTYAPDPHVRGLMSRAVEVWISNITCTDDLNFFAPLREGRTGAEPDLHVVQGVQDLLQEMWQLSVEEGRNDDEPADRPPLGAGLFLTDQDVRLLRKNPSLQRRSSTSTGMRAAAAQAGHRLSATMPARFPVPRAASDDSAQIADESDLPRPGSFAVAGLGMRTLQTDVAACSSVAAQSAEADGLCSVHTPADRSSLIQPERAAPANAPSSRHCEQGASEGVCQHESTSHLEQVAVKELEEVPQDAAEMAQMYDAMMRQMQGMQVPPLPCRQLRRQCAHASIRMHPGAS